MYKKQFDDVPNATRIRFRVSEIELEYLHNLP